MDVALVTEAKPAFTGWDESATGGLIERGATFLVRCVREVPLGLDLGSRKFILLCSCAVTRRNRKVWSFRVRWEWRKKREKLHERRAVLGRS